MSRPPSRPKLVGPDGASPVGAMTLTGLVRTSRGYAVASLVVEPDGTQAFRLGNSQVYPEHIAAEHKKMLVKASLAAQVAR